MFAVLPRLIVFRIPGAIFPLLFCVALMGCVSGGGAGLGLFADSRGGLGVALRGHSVATGYRLESTESAESAAPLLGVELGTGFSFTESAWKMQVGVPIGAGTWDDTDAGYGIRGAPKFVMDFTWPPGEPRGVQAVGGAVDFAWLPHLATERDPLQGQDTVRIQRFGPAVSAALLNDGEGWFGSLFLGVMYDFEAYLSASR